MILAFSLTFSPASGGPRPGTVHHGVRVALAHGGEQQQPLPPGPRQRPLEGPGRGLFGWPPGLAWARFDPSILVRLWNWQEQAGNGHGLGGWGSDARPLSLAGPGTRRGGSCSRPGGVAGRWVRLGFREAWHPQEVGHLPYSHPNPSGEKFKNPCESTGYVFAERVPCVRTLGGVNP